MPVDPADTIYYRHARFTTRLPKRWLYAPSHYWMAEASSDRFRVGITKFASRMLGDFVELDFVVNPGETVQHGHPIGSIEGFKAVAEVYCVVNGTFAAANEEVRQQPDLIDSDPYDRGWLYEIDGSRPDDAMTVDEYIGLLDATIDKMLEEQRKRDDGC